MATGSSSDSPSGRLSRNGDAAPKIPMRILCVEDNEGDFHLLREHLKDASFDQVPQLHHARTLAEAVALINKEGPAPFDVILLDLNLPDSQGTETFHGIRTIAPEAAITILSGTTDQELALALVQQGAQDYLPKDAINPNLLTRCILYAVERQRLHREMAALNQGLQRAKNEVETMQMQLIQAEKLDSLGRLAASIAHEVKNPLGTIQMGVDFFLRRRSDLGESAGSMLDCMQNAITRAVRIVHEMLDFSRSENLEMHPCVVNDLAATSLNMIQHELNKRKINIVTEFADGIPDIRVDRSKIEQVVINLLTNAAHAMPPGGTIKLRTRHGEILNIQRNEGLREMDLLKPGDEVVVIEVRDYGVGIPQDVMRRIFEPFFTTKPTGEGTGLGLPVAKRIIDLHRGYLQIANVENPNGVRARIILKADFSNTPKSSANLPRHLATAPEPATA